MKVLSCFKRFFVCGTFRSSFQLFLCVNEIYFWCEEKSLFGEFVGENLKISRLCCYLEWFSYRYEQILRRIWFESWKSLTTYILRVVDSRTLKRSYESYSSKTYKLQSIWLVLLSYNYLYHIFTWKSNKS